jgi:hypothetical protein
VGLPFVSYFLVARPQSMAHDGIEHGITLGEPFGHFVYWAVTRHPPEKFTNDAVDQMIRDEYPQRHLALGGNGTYQPIPRQRSYARTQQHRLGIHGDTHAAEILARIDAKIGTGVNRFAEGVYPDELASASLYWEGATRRISVNAYERSDSARNACIAHFGYLCSVCGFDFAATYGEIGREFIQVHHLKDLASIGEGYEVDPVNDLLPVCPNCHAMLHTERPAMSIAKLKSLIAQPRIERRHSCQAN